MAVTSIRGAQMVLRALSSCALLMGLVSALPAAAQASVTNTASVTNPAGVSCTAPVSGTCVKSASDTDTVLSPQLTLTKTASAGSFVVGQAASYTLQVRNNGTTATPAATAVSDAVAAGLKIGALPSGCVASGQAVSCTVPTGLSNVAPNNSASFVIPVTPTAAAGNSVTNTASASGGGDPACSNAGTCTSSVTTPVNAPKLTLVKTASAGSFVVGQAASYTLQLSNTGTTATTAATTVSDAVPAGLVIGALPSGCVASGQTVSCTVPVGLSNVAPNNSASFVIPVTPTAAAGSSVTNTASASGGGDPACSNAGACTSSVSTPINASKLTLVKTASAARFVVGQAASYTLQVSNTGTTATTTATTVIDPVPAGLTLGTLPSGCTASGQTVSCTVPAGLSNTAPNNSTSFVIPVTPTAAAGDSVTNTASASGGGDPTCGNAGSCTSSVTTPVVKAAVSVAKTVDPSGEVLPGATLTYTLTATVSQATTGEALTLSDTLGTGLSFGAVIAPGAYSCSVSGQVLTCTLPAGKAPGTYPVSYTATVNANATGTLSNTVVPSNPAGGDPEPTCSTCTSQNTVKASKVTVAKSSAPGSGTSVAVGDAIAYTLTVTVANSATTGAVTLTDTFGIGQALSGSLPQGCTASGGGLVCTLAAGTLPGTYTFAYGTRVTADAGASVGNVVVPSGSDSPACTTCTTTHPLLRPSVTVRKTSDPGVGSSVTPGQAITYTVTATVSVTSTLSSLTLNDTLTDNQTLVAPLPAGCTGGGHGLTCTLPSGTAPGTYAFVYRATVNADASGSAGNTVVPAGNDNPTCDAACATRHPIAAQWQLKLLKTTAVSRVQIGDLVRYTLSVENIGASDFHGSITDAPPAGFSYVAGSLAASDMDGAAQMSGRNPLRIDGVDVAAHGTATYVYLLRVGAGVQSGTHVNTAVARTTGGNVVSNTSSASVTLASDPLLDESLVFGTVFDDRDGDGWQDSAALSGVRVQGGFAPGAYVAGSTSVDRGQGPKPEADASAPLLHGVAIGEIAARQSEGDPADGHQVVVRQVLRSLDFTDDFVLTSAQGVSVRMDASGQTRVEKSGEAAKGLNAAAPTVERRVAQGEGGYVVDYVIRNAGIDERGIPGVRIATVEGLLMETDQFGRYHLIGLDGGNQYRGRNVILKVDPATLPPGAAFTTANPLLRRVTPGVPVRFDFGVKLPVVPLAAPAEAMEVDLGEVLFAPGSAQLREQYAPVVAKMAAQVEAHQGGEVVIRADGETSALAFERAGAVRDALQAALTPASAAALKVEVRADALDGTSTVAGVDGAGVLLGSVLFETDQSAIRPQYDALLERVAAWLAQHDGGTVSLVGHADRRASDAYNLALGMRRARAVYEAIATRLPPELRAKVRVQSIDPKAPAGKAGK